MRLVLSLPHGHALALDAIMSPRAATPSIPFSCEPTAQRGLRAFSPSLSLAPSTFSTYLPFSLFFKLADPPEVFPLLPPPFFSPSSPLL